MEYWAVIAEDVERLAPLGHGEELFWARIRFLALDYLIWRDDNHLHGLCRKWVDELQADNGLDNSLQNELHRLDVLIDLFHDVLKIASAAGMKSVALICSLSWYQPILEYRPILYAFMEDLLQDVAAGLEKMDQVQRQAPLLIGQLLRAFEGLRYLSRKPARADPPKRPLLKSMEEYLQNVDWHSYPHFRVALLYFCMREYVEIPVLVALLSGRQFPQQIAQNLTWAFEDAPLICMVQVHCLFWQ